MHLILCDVFPAIFNNVLKVCGQAWWIVPPMISNIDVPNERCGDRKPEDVNLF